jgi:hypothetical protein
LLNHLGLYPRLILQAGSVLVIVELIRRFRFRVSGNTGALEVEAPVIHSCVVRVVSQISRSSNLESSFYAGIVNLTSKIKAPSALKVKDAKTSIGRVRLPTMMERINSCQCKGHIAE